MKRLKPSKPYMLRRWQIVPPASSLESFFFTCARPGRTSDPATKYAQVSDETVHRWVLGLPGPDTAIVSLLGRKPDGLSEFSFYSFYGGFDPPSEHPGRLSFHEWLDRWHGDLSIWVRQHPTWDFEAIEGPILDEIASDINELLAAGRTVVVVDSGGVTCTGMVCRHMHAAEVTGHVASHVTLRSQ